MKHIRIDRTKPILPLSPLLRGACMEDVNHELYGGIWSQMIFGEAFAEPAVHCLTSETFTAFGSSWDSDGTVLSCSAESDGPKAVFETVDFCDGTVSADFTLHGGGPVGFVCRISEASGGADSFNGYEIAVSREFVRLARHRHNFRKLADVPISIQDGQEFRLTATLTGPEIVVSVDGTEYIRFTDSDPILAGRLGIRAWEAGMEMRNPKLNGVSITLPTPAVTPDVSGMWMALEGETASFALSSDGFCGEQSQLLRGKCAIGNRGLNRSGMYFAAGREYRGYLYAKSEGARLVVSLRNADGRILYSSQAVEVSGDWRKYEFLLTAEADEIDGTFAVALNGGECLIGYVYLEPAEWGLYKGMHVRRDVGEGLEHMGLSVLRFGGCMVNSDGYRWKKMLGAPEERAPYRGWWYAYSSLGFGILEFMELCEKLNVECVPDFHGYESEEDMRDFARYALGTDPADEWTARRMASSHPDPYRLHYIQFGNEECVNEAFADRFIAACREVWSVAPQITMVAGDFDFRKPIEDPYHLDPAGTACHLPDLRPHERILKFAVEAGQNDKAFLDIHWPSDHGRTPLPFPECAESLYDTLHSMVPETGAKLCVYELNAWTHDFERSLSNAYSILCAINHSEKIPCMCSANCLQVERQNDNGWDQGLLFMNNRSVWYQAPAVLLQMLSEVWRDGCASFNEEEIADETFNAAVMAGDGKTSVCMVNRSDHAEEVIVDLPEEGKVEWTMRAVSHPKNTVNTESSPETIVFPKAVSGTAEGMLTFTLPANTIATLVF